MVTLTCLLLMAAAPFEPLPTTPWTQGAPASMARVFGPSPVSAMTGNGRLTVSLDAAGSVVGVRWPSPGYFEHGLIPIDGDPARTLRWGVDDGEELHWNDGADGTQGYRSPASVIVENAATAGPYRIQQEAFVHPALDALLVRVHIAGGPPPARCVIAWRPVPTSRLLPEVPLPARNAGGTLTFQGTGRVYAVKPHDHSATTLALLDEAAASRAGIDALSTDGPATWLGVATYPEPSAIRLAPAGHEPSLGRYEGIGAHALTGAAGAYIEVQPEPNGDGWEVWVAMGAADDRGGLDEILTVASERRGFLVDGAERFWMARLQRAHLPGTPDGPEAAIASRALLTILMLQDRTSGAIMRAPVSWPPLALDRPADSVWASQALARAGFTAEAQRHARFLAAAMRDGRRRSHDGSFADAYYADGAPAMPPQVLDADHSAWFIWSTRAMADLLPPAQAAAFHESAWGPVQRAANFVHRWWDPVRRRPLAAYDPLVLRDRARPEQLLTAYGALDNALAIAAELGERRDEWVSRRAELRALIDYHLVDPDGQWRLPGPMDYWPMGAFPLEAPIWDRIVEDARTAGLPAHEAAHALHFQARALAERQQPVPNGFTAEAARAAQGSLYAGIPVLGGFWPDSLTAAHIYLALIHAERAAQLEAAPTP